MIESAAGEKPAEGLYDRMVKARVKRAAVRHGPGPPSQAISSLRTGHDFAMSAACAGEAI